MLRRPNWLKCGQERTLLAELGQLKQDKMERDYCKVICSAPTTLQGNGIELNRIEWLHFTSVCSVLHFCLNAIEIDCLWVFFAEVSNRLQKSYRYISTPIKHSGRYFMWQQFVSIRVHKSRINCMVTLLYILTQKAECLTHIFLSFLPVTGHSGRQWQAISTHKA